MKTHSCSFLSRWALPGLMSLFLLAPGSAWADNIGISASAGGLCVRPLPLATMVLPTMEPIRITIISLDS
jgi:hypothetical protein